MSEELGDKGVHAHMKAKGYDCVYEGSGAYTFDRIYKKDGKFYVVEAKGANSGLGGKQAKVDGEYEYVQQGTKPYLERTLEDMMKKAKSSKDIKLYNDVETIKGALKKSDVKYLLGKQKVKPDNSLGNFEMKEFDIK